MKFTVERSLFLDAVTKLLKVVGNKTTMPVLEGILISAEQGKITMASYNLEMGMKKEIYALTEEKGDIVINAKILSDILRKMGGTQIEITADSRLMCHIKCDETEFDIMGMAAEDFPEMPSVSDGEKLVLSGKVFNEMVRGTLFAVSQIEGTRPILTGLYVLIKDNNLQFVGIDGFRLAIRKQKTELSNNMEFIMTGKAVNEVSKLIDENTEEVEITVGKRLLCFNINGYVFISRLLEGEFVNYQKLIPENYQQKIKINCNEFINAVERVSLLINDSFTTPVRCEFKKNDVLLSSATSLGRAKEMFNLDLEGEEFEIGLNSRYLLDSLHACDSENITVKFNGANAGVVITPETEENDDFLYLIMPMRLK